LRPAAVPQRLDEWLGAFVYTKRMPRMTARGNGWLLLPLLLILSACQGSTQQSRLGRLTPEALYGQAESALHSGNYQEAIATYEALNARYPFTAQGKQSRLDIIYAYYRAGEKESARDAADSFIRENPTHPRIDYAWYLKGLVDFERTPQFIERWMNVDLSERPPTTASDALQSFRIVVERFPKSPYAGDARHRMVYLRNRLADHDLQIARYYASRKAWVAAAQRSQQVIEEFDGAPAVKDALRLMIRSYNELGFSELADNAKKVFAENFPDEPLEFVDKGDSWWKFWS
jgi:outer membrane protein assembly factor BamD